MILQFFRAWVYPLMLLKGLVANPVWRLTDRFFSPIDLPGRLNAACPKGNSSFFSPTSRASGTARLTKLIECAQMRRSVSPGDWPEIPRSVTG
ncbi:MAG TPA: hypothetical protein VNM72_03420 [Blastocatellia bacterium]|nr:hypothetical protein [Blastocatellia bacterium]